MKIIIAGAGKNGTALAISLSKEHDVLLVDKRADRIERARAMAPYAETLIADATEAEVLEGILSGVDLLVTTAGSDEVNLVIAMLAKRIGAPSVFSRVNHPANEWLFDKEWGVDVAVSSSAILQGLIEKQIGIGDIATLLKLQSDGVAVDEVNVPAGCGCVGKTLGSITMPDNVIVMAVLGADGGVKQARDETIVSGGDQLLLLAKGDIDRSSLREALGIVPTPVAVEE